MKLSYKIFFPALVLATALLFILNLLVGSVNIPATDVWQILTGSPAGNEGWRYIVVESRMPQALTALLCGCALSCCGLLLQTAFQNPLAGPGIFGISNGAGVGVALVMLLAGGGVSVSSFSIGGYAAIIVAAFLGALAVTALILFFSTLVRDNTMLLIVGIMVGYLASSAISLLSFAATEEGVRSYMVWGMGNFTGVSMKMMPFFACCIFFGLGFAMLLMKPLNIMILGERYAENLGVSMTKVRNLLLVSTSLLTAIATAFCGPVTFIGLAVPHLARLSLKTANHRLLLPATILMGGLVALCCNLVCCLPCWNGVLPLNAVTPVIGAPVVIYVIMQRKNFV